LWDKVSSTEQALLLAETPIERQTIDATWRCESLQTLLWCIGKLREMPPASKLCSVPAMLDLMPEPGGKLTEFYRDLELRSEAEFNELYARTHYQHWQVGDAQIHGKPMPADLDPGVIYERHYAMNWVRYYEDDGWDEVTTDT
jgi:hypothetical protein